MLERSVLELDRMIGEGEGNDIHANVGNIVRHLSGFG